MIMISMNNSGGAMPHQKSIKKIIIFFSVSADLHGLWGQLFLLL
ncbi:hypothetical protein GMMP1_360050 [Candidatus Magnetomoraceae bacterium gMMP-1]